MPLLGRLLGRRSGCLPRPKRKPLSIRDALRVLGLPSRAADSLATCVAKQDHMEECIRAVSSADPGADPLIVKAICLLDAVAHAKAVCGEAPADPRLIPGLIRAKARLRKIASCVNKRLGGQPGQHSSPG